MSAQAEANCFRFVVLCHPGENYPASILILCHYYLCTPHTNHFYYQVERTSVLEDCQRVRLQAIKSSKQKQAPSRHGAANSSQKALFHSIYLSLPPCWDSMKASNSSCAPGCPYESFIALGHLAMMVCWVFTSMLVSIATSSILSFSKYLTVINVRVTLELVGVPFLRCVLLTL